MPSWTSADKTALMNDNDGFSDAAYYDGSASPIYGFFSNDFALLSLVAGDVASSEALFMCKTADVTSAVKGTAVVRNSVNYVVTAKKPDGTGMTTLVLKKA